MVEAAQSLVMDDRRITVEEIAAALNISKGSVHTILHDHLQMNKCSTKWVPRLLTPEMRQNRLDCAEEALEQWNTLGYGILGRLVTGDETWIHHYDPLTG